MGVSRFNRLWLSSGAANLGDGILFAGLPVLASTITTSPLLIALVEVSIFGPMLIAALPSGVAADRYDRTRIMTVANLLRGVGLAALAGFALTGEWVLASVYMAGVLLGLFETLSDSAAQTALPMIVDRAGLTKANSRLIGTQTVLNDGVGAPLGSVLATTGAVGLFAVPGLLYGIGSGLSALLGRLAPASSPQARTSVRREVGEGFAFLWSHPALRRMGVTNGISNMGNAAFSSVGILFFIGPYGLPRAGFGVALGLLALGGVAGAVIGDRAVETLGHRRVLLLGAASVGLGYAAIGTVSNVWLASCALFGIGLTGMVWNVSNRVVRQVLTPEPLLGRVTSVMRVTALTASPLGAVLGGITAQSFGLPAVVVITTITQLAAVLLVARIPVESLALGRNS